jgi:DNA-binding GntR family transcriptional regulator
VRVTLSRSMLRHQIKDVVVERILDGAYRPGERIVETHLAQELGVSKAPVREALRELEPLRLVVCVPHRGARVRSLTPDEMSEGRTVRAALEALAAGVAVEHLRGDVRPLATEIDAMRAAAARDDLHEFITHDVGFHRLVVEASGNRTLADLWEALHVELRTTITLIRWPGDLDAVAEGHVPVLEALAAGDGDAAATEMRRHIESWTSERRLP